MQYVKYNNKKEILPRQLNQARRHRLNRPCSGCTTRSRRQPFHQNTFLTPTNVQTSNALLRFSNLCKKKTVATLRSHRAVKKKRKEYILSVLFITSTGILTLIKVNIQTYSVADYGGKGC